MQVKADAFVCGCGNRVLREHTGRTFCPQCGRRLARCVLGLEGEPTEVMRGGRLRIAIENQGVASCQVQSCRIHADPEMRGLAILQALPWEARRGRSTLDVCVPQDARPARYRLAFEIGIDDGARSDPWDPASVLEAHRFETNLDVIAWGPLVASPAAGIFHDERWQREFEVGVPYGMQKVQVPQGIALPSGVRLVPDAGAAAGAGAAGPSAASAAGELGIAPDRPLHLTAEIDSLGSGRSDDRLSVQGEGSQVEVPVLRLGSPLLQSLPAVVVGIDFGTANCSIRCMEAAGTLVTVPNGTARFPSAIFIEKPEVGGGIFFGTQALLEYRARPSQGELVRGLKSLLREDPEDQRERTLSPVDLAARFFRHIRDLVIRECRAQLGFDITDLSPSDLRYRLCLPVLNQDKGYELQRQTTLRAASMAGIPEESITFEHEPVAAALYCVCDYLDLQVDDGDLIMVFDAGGGTTDVSLLEVAAPASGQPQLRYCGGFGTGDGIQFGGFHVDDWLEHDLQVDRALVEGVPSEKDRTARRTFVVERAKERVGQERGKPVNLGDVEQELGYRDRLLGGLQLDEGQLQATLQEPLRALRARLDACLRNEVVTHRSGGAGIDPGAVRYVFPVGGSSLLPPVMEMLKRFFPNGTQVVELDADQRRHAVVEGLMRYRRIRVGQRAPYAIVARRPSADDHRVLLQGRALAGRIVPITYEVGRGADVGFELRAVCEGREYPLNAFVLKNPCGERADLIIDFVPTGGGVEVFETWKTGAETRPRRLIWAYPV